MLTREFYLRDATICAKELLGKLLVHQTENGTLSGIIVETEAYMGPEDAAAHSYNNRHSKRTEIQYGRGGFAYIYLIYGMYDCFNVVVNVENRPEAVLIRALEPVDGIELMHTNRSCANKANLTNGPGKLCRALNINKKFYGHDLCTNPLFIEDSLAVEESDIMVSPRVNIDYAGDYKNKLWRYFIRDNKYVSPHANNKNSFSLSTI